MGRYLKVDDWFDRTSTGTLRMKRVSAAHEAAFPKRFRLVYQQSGPAGLVVALRDEYDYTLSDAWATAKDMFNAKRREA